MEPPAAGFEVLVRLAVPHWSFTTYPVTREDYRASGDQWQWERACAVLRVGTEARIVSVITGSWLGGQKIANGSVVECKVKWRVNVVN